MSADSVLILSDAKAYMNVTGSDDDALITEMIDQASLAVSKEIGVETIIEATYDRERHDGDGSTDLWLNNWPVNEVLRVAIGFDDAMTVSYSGAATHANVLITDAALKIRFATAGTWTTTSFAFSSYATITLLAAAVDAVSGWSADPVTGYGNWPSVELLPHPASNAKDETVELSVANENDDDIILGSVAWGILYRGVGWNVSMRNITIDYIAGWPIASVPQPLKSAVYQLTDMLYRTSKTDSTKDEEELGDYSYKASRTMGKVLSSGQAQDLIEPMIKNYRRPVFLAV